MYCENNGFKEVEWETLGEFIRRVRSYDPRTNIDSIVGVVVLVYIVVVLVMYKFCCASYR